MYYGPGEDDWCWVRWYLCQEGARTVPFDHLYQYQLWEDLEAHPRLDPQVRMLPSQFRPLTLSPFPGLHVVGDETTWNSDLGPDELGEDVPAVTSHCGAEHWWTAVPVRVAGTSDLSRNLLVLAGGAVGGGRLLESGGAVVLAGGAVGGGSLVMGSPCRLWFGSCEDLAGGAVGGGALVMGGGGAESLAGGAVAGGSLSQGPAPYVVASTGNRATNGAHANNKPAGTTAGDHVVIFDAVYSSLGIVPPTPSGFLSLSSGTTAAGTMMWNVSHKVAGAGEPASWPVSQGASRLVTSIVVSVRGATGIPSVTQADGHGTTLTVSGVTLSGVGALRLLWAALIAVGGDTLSFPGGMTLQALAGTAPDAALFRDRPGPAGTAPSAGIAYTPTASDLLALQVGIPSPVFDNA